MNYLLAMLVVLVPTSVACGPSTFDYPHEHRALCFRFHSTQPFESTVALATNVVHVQDLFREGGLTDDFCGVVGHVNVILLDETFKAGGEEVAGICLPGTDVMLMVRSAINLMHEALHRWDFHHLAYGSIDHVAWDKNGYDALWREYVRRRARI